MRTQVDSLTKTCTKDGCDRPLRARGLCSTHYNQTLPNRHARVAKQCDGCGKPVLKENRKYRYLTVQCGDMVCRMWLSYGVGWSEKLPADHWARMYGAAAEWPRHRRKDAPAKSYACAWCGTECSSRMAGARFCGVDHKTKAKRARRRARQFNAPGEYTWAQLVRLWVAFDKACAYCRVATPLDEIQAEHVVALSKGGANNLSNLLPSCASCNADKRDLSLAEWSADRRRRHLTAVITDWHERDPLYAHLTSVRGALQAA